MRYIMGPEYDKSDAFIINLIWRHITFKKRIEAKEKRRSQRLKKGRNEESAELF